MRRNTEGTACDRGIEQKAATIDRQTLSDSDILHMLSERPVVPVPEKETAGPSLRYAPAGMTILCDRKSFGEKYVTLRLALSSRPERRVAEGPAVLSGHSHVGVSRGLIVSSTRPQVSSIQ
jgi:hypothetical protein